MMVKITILLRTTEICSAKTRDLINAAESDALISLSLRHGQAGLLAAKQFVIATLHQGRKVDCELPVLKKKKRKVRKIKDGKENKLE